MALERGRLVLSRKGKPQIEIAGKLFNPAQGELSQSFFERLKELNGAEVEFELQGGQPKRIREAGSDFVPAHSGGTHAGGQRQIGRDRDTREETAGGATNGHRDFHNPYNFIPAPPRNPSDPDLGDHEPVSQDRFHLDRYTGRIRVAMEAVTPLLVPDPESCREEGNGHKTFALLLGKDGRPLIPSSSMRGMLRAAYEAVTNSRFGCFPKKDHEKHLAYRMEPRDGLRLIPARIENGQIRLLTGTSAVNNDGSPNGPQYAAWLPRYSGRNKDTQKALRYSDGSLPCHGDEVVCRVELVQHHRWDKKKNEHIPDFQYWGVRAIAKKGDVLPDVQASPPIDPASRRSRHQGQGKMQQIQGWVCITNANINRKHDERVFFSHAPPSNPPGPFPLTDKHRGMWGELIENYQAIHEIELENRLRSGQASDQYIGPEPGRTAWSRHVYDENALDLRDGTLCYVRLTENRSLVEAIFPVMISRELYQSSPWDLLDPTLCPARKISELSPAERVFGWVRTDYEKEERLRDGISAVRGLLRVGPVVCESSAEEAIETFSEPGLPLAILAAPKPQQGRFYVAALPSGEVQTDGLTKAEAGYAPGKGLRGRKELRGRKVYPHHKGLPSSHWENPLEDRTQSSQGPWQEYRRPNHNGEEQDEQNRSILGWVKPGARFSFDIYATNLSKVELGALLFLLTLPQNHFYRFGGGKPLGFGSVRLSAMKCELYTGPSLCQRYRSWTLHGSTEEVSQEAIAAFEDAVRRAYGHTGSRVVEAIPFIRAFMLSARGFDDNLPIHYPRATSSGNPGPASPAGEAFKWFVANERRGARYALPDLGDDAGLPTLKDPQAST